MINKQGPSPSDTLISVVLSLDQKGGKKKSQSCSGFLKDGSICFSLEKLQKQSEQYYSVIKQDGGHF